MYDYTYNTYKEENVSKTITDLDIVFGIHPLSKDIRKKTNIEAIKQSIKTLILLNHYEKPFHPDIGCDIYKSMFEMFEGNFTRTMMEGYIKKMINNYEPRAALEKIDINVDEDNNSLGITIWFTPESETEVVSVDIFLRILR